MDRFEIHTITSCSEDLGVMMFDNGELAVYPTAKLAQRVADGMNSLKDKFSEMKYKYTVKEVQK